jgi:hypothetical protein
VWIFTKRFLARSKEVLWGFTRGVNGQTPTSPRRYRGQTEIDRIVPNPLFFRVSPVGQSPTRAKPVDLGVRVELFLAQNWMGTAKGHHTTGETENFPVLIQTAPVIPARFIILTIGIVVTSLGASKFVAAEQHRHPARDKEGEQEVFDLTLSDRLNAGVVCFALDAVITAVIRVSPVVITFPIGAKKTTGSYPQ